MLIKLQRLLSQRFFWGLVSQTVIKLLATALGLYTTSWLVSHSTVSEYAEFTVVISYVTIIQTIIILGIPNLIQKFYTHNENVENIASFWTSMVCLRLASYGLGIILILFSYLLSTSTNLVLIIATFSSQFLILTDELFRSICDAKGRTWQYSLTDFLERLVFVFLLIFYSQGWWLSEVSGLWYFIGVSFITRSLVILADAWWQRHFLAWSWPSLEVFRANLWPIVYLSLSGITIALFNHTRQLIISFYGASELVLGAFYNANKLFSIALIVPGMTIPMIASLVVKRAKQQQTTWFSQWFSQKLNFSNKPAIIGEFLVYSLVFGLTLSLGLWLTAPWGVWLIDPNSKYPTVFTIDQLRILGLSLVTYPTVILISHLLVLLDHEKYEFFSTIVMSGLGLVAYFSLAKLFGPYGVAGGVVLVNLIDLIVKLFLLRKVLVAIGK